MMFLLCFNDCVDGLELLYLAYVTWVAAICSLFAWVYYL